MLDEQWLRLENPYREANILLLTMDHVDRVKLFAIGDEEHAINPVHAQEVEPMVIRQPPFVAHPDDIPELAKQAQSPKPRVLKESQSKLAEAQRADKALRPIFAWVEKRECRLPGKQRKLFESWIKHYLLQDGLLYKRVQIEKDEQPIAVLVVPTEMRMTIMQSFHDASRHCGHTKTWSQLQKRFYWEGCHKEVKSYCRACQFCFSLSE
jgi:hypothetical protein